MTIGYGMGEVQRDGQNIIVKCDRVMDADSALQMMQALRNAIADARNEAQEAEQT